jgi:hypothetical protein
MFKHKPFDLTNRMRRQSAVAGQHHWIEPKLALAVTGSNVNMRRFTPFVGVKVKPISADA